MEDIVLLRDSNACSTDGQVQLFGRSETIFSEVVAKEVGLK